MLAQVSDRIFRKTNMVSSVDPIHQNPHLRLTELDQFVEHFEVLIETIADSAHYGPSQKLETTYQSSKALSEHSYLSLKPFLNAYLPTEPPRSGWTLSHCPGMDCASDHFESLWEPKTLAELLDLDDGSMILRIEQCLHAIQHYRSHLRYLLTKTA